MNTRARFWDRMAERYARQPVGNPEHYEKKLALTQHYLTAESTVLEFGCGTGSTALRHAPLVGSMLATDYSPGMIAIANRKLAETTIGNLRFACAGLSDLQEPEASFDAVLGLNVLHLMPDYRGAIRRSAALLKPGGVFVTSTACIEGKWALLRVVLGPLAAAGLIPRVVFIRARDLEQEMTDAGLSVIEKLPGPGRIGALFLIARKDSSH